MTLAIDGGCFVGHELDTGFRYSVEQLLADMDRLGVGRALVGAYRAIYQDIREGNRDIARIAAAHPDRVIPLGLLHPAFYGESPDQLLAWMHEELGFRAVGLVSRPQYYPVSWDTPAVRGIGEAAERRGLVLQAGIVDEGELAAVGRAWGNLNTPVHVRWLGGHRYKVMASEIAAAAQYPNLRFDVGNAASTGAVATLAARIGARRLFVASNAPHQIADCAHAVLRDSCVSPADARDISGATIAADLRLETAERAESGGDSWDDLLTRSKVDIHWHPDSWNLGEPALSESDQRAAFDRYGYERVIVSSIRALNDDIVEGNALASTWTRIDSRVFALIVVNPLEPERSIDMIRRYADDPRFVGIKTIQDVFGVGLDDAAYRPLLEAASEKGLPVVAHLPGMDRAAERYPQLQFVATHGNWGRTHRHRALSNIAFDFSTGHALRHETQLARFGDAVGWTRVLYGSDGQLVSPAWTLAKLHASAIAGEALEAVLRTNAYRVFPRLKQPRDSTS